MPKCPKCGKELEDGSKFCDSCGAQVFETIFCPNCGEKTSSEYAFCQNCGAAITEGLVPAVTDAKAAPGGKRALSRKALFIGGGIAVIVVLAALIFSLVGKGSSKGNYALYLKDREIVYTDFTEKGTQEITSRLVNDASVSDADIAGSGQGLGYYIAFSKDGKRVFYPDRLDNTSDGITLYYRDINKPNADPVKIDSDIMSYAIDDSGSCVVYCKGSDGILYRHNLKDKEKIASDVVSFHVTSDCKKVGYLNDQGNYYIWYTNKDSVKLASDISEIYRVSDDISTIYYIKDDSLYKQTEGSGDKAKIASDVNSVVRIYDSGEVYYTKAESGDISLMDYVDDDMAGVDSAMEEPQYPTYPDSPRYPSWFDYDTTEAYNAAKNQYNIDYEAYQAECNRLNEEYQQAREDYYDKLSRDSLRESLRNASMENTQYTLCYYDGKESTTVTDALTSGWIYNYAADKPVALVSVYNQSEVRKVKLSEISSAYEVNGLVEEAMYSSSEYYVTVGASMTVVDQTEADNFVISSDGSQVYFLDDISDNGEGDLYQITISKGQVGSPKLYDTDVSRYGIYFISDNKIVYYKNVSTSDYKGDLFVDKTEVDYDVRIYSARMLGDSVLYYTDWNSDKQYGTLTLFKGSKKTKVADDVHDFTVTKSDAILYLYDYSLKHYSGTLFLYRNNKAQQLDDDVSALIPIRDTRVKGD